MTKNASRYTFAATAVLAVAFTVTGCSAGSTTSASSTGGAKVPLVQSHAAACKEVQDGFKNVAALRGDISSAIGDPTKAAALLDKLDAQVKAIDQHVDNAQVKKVTSSAAGAIDDYDKYVKNALNNPASVDATQVEKKALDLGTKFAAVQKECA